MLAELRLHKRLDVRGRLRSRVSGDDVCLGDLPTQGVWHAHHSCLDHRWVFEQRLLDLHRAHRPASRDNDIVRATLMVEIPCLVAVPTIFNVEPLALALDGDIATLTWW